MVSDYNSPMIEKKRNRIIKPFRIRHCSASATTIKLTAASNWTMTKRKCSTEIPFLPSSIRRSHRSIESFTEPIDQTIHSHLICTRNTQKSILSPRASTPSQQRQCLRQETCQIEVKSQSKTRIQSSIIIAQASTTKITTKTRVDYQGKIPLFPQNRQALPRIITQKEEGISCLDPIHR